MRLVFLALALALVSGGVALPAAAEDSVAVPSFVEETASAGIDSVYAGEWEYMVGGGVATFDCNGDRFDDMLLAGGELARQILPQRKHTRRCLALRGGDQRSRTGQGDGRLSARHRQRRQHRSGVAAGWRKRRDARPWRLPLRARQRSLGLRWRRRLVDRACRDLGARGRLADDRHRQLHRPP